MMKKYALLLLLPIVMLGMLSSCSNDGDKKLQAKVDELQAQVDAYKAERAETAKNLVAQKKVILLILVLLPAKNQIAILELP